MFYLTTHSTHFIHGYMASDIWLRTILIVRKETRCHHIGYSYRCDKCKYMGYPDTISGCARKLKKKKEKKKRGGNVSVGFFSAALTETLRVAGGRHGPQALAVARPVAAVDGRRVVEAVADALGERALVAVAPEVVVPHRGVGVGGVHRVLVAGARGVQPVLEPYRPETRTDRQTDRR